MPYRRRPPITGKAIRGWQALRSLVIVNLDAPSESDLQFHTEDELNDAYALVDYLDGLAIWFESHSGDAP